MPLPAASGQNRLSRNPAISEVTTISAKVTARKPCRRQFGEAQERRVVETVDADLENHRRQPGAQAVEGGQQDGPAVAREGLEIGGETGEHEAGNVVRFACERQRQGGEILLG